MLARFVVVSAQPISTALLELAPRLIVISQYHLPVVFEIVLPTDCHTPPLETVAVKFPPERTMLPPALAGSKVVKT
jgi:hypothetical protein